jgi:hypothetical protein
MARTLGKLPNQEILTEANVLVELGGMDEQIYDLS